VICHAYPPLDHSAGLRSSASAGERSDRLTWYAAELAEAAEPGLTVVPAPVPAPVREALLGAVELPCLVVIGTGGAGRMAEALLAEPTLGASGLGASGPIAVVRGSATGSGHPFAGHVVVAVECPESDAAVTFAFMEAELRRLPLVAVGASARGTPGGLPGRDETAAWAMVEAAVAPYRRRHRRVEAKLAVHAGHPVGGILKAAVDAALLVVGSADPSAGAGGPVDGSMRHAAITGAPCPVVVVPTVRDHPDGWPSRLPSHVISSLR